MAVVVAAPPALTGDLALFHTTDPLLSNSPVLVFHGPAATIGATSSRIQVHVFTPAGTGSYTRLAISPNSPFYSAVSNLPREEQGDEVVRGLAFGLKKYFVELPETVKKTWCTQVKTPSPAMLFGDDHVAVLASRMTRIENVDEVVQALSEAFCEQRQSWLDVDVVLPAGTIKDTAKRGDSLGDEDLLESDLLQQKYGRYAELIGGLGETAFLPTSKLKRAPSKQTNIGRSTSFLRHQKEVVRKEICELLETEDSYVGRLRELHRISKMIHGDLRSSSQQQLQSCFPEALTSILDLNTQFAQALRILFVSTQTSANQDIEATSDTPITSKQTSLDLAGDAQGVYLKDQPQASQSLRALFRSPDTALIAALQEIGEQRLNSLLIEPVQRLPRYTLYIDSITKQLPVRHPAIKPLLKARDIITDICIQDDFAGNATSICNTLQAKVASWPSDCAIAGRLVTVVDVIELEAPYALHGCDGASGILLVFTDSVILLERTTERAIAARALQSELENVIAAVQPLSPRPDAILELRFLRKVRLDACDFTESIGGRAVQLTTRFSLVAAAHPLPQHTVDSCQILRLAGSYDGKAARLTEEVTKARVEARFSESERESSQWDVRASDPAADHASLLSATFDDSCSEHIAARRQAAPVRILVDIDKHSQRPRAGHAGIRTVIATSPLKDGLWRLTIDSIDGSASREHVAAIDLISTLSKRLALLSLTRYSIEDQSVTAYALTRNAGILTSIELEAHPEDEAHERADLSQERLKRPKSPRKLLSSFLSSTGPGSQAPTFMKKDLPPLPPPPSQQRLRYGSESISSEPPSRESRPPSRDQPTPRSLNSMRSIDQLSSQKHSRLEETLSAYVLALQARKGNIVGRSLKMRATADELTVNELYNGLLEDPNLMVLAAQATVDVLFAAFEKFVNMAWKEQIGQIVPYAVIQEIQSKAETLFPSDFDNFFRSAVSGLAPQNQRAFKTIMKLLADLLDGTGNDGDRGILTAAFAEVLVPDGNPHDFIPLIDRFVDDTETYFGEPVEDTQRLNEGPGSIHKRARSVNSASISSNTSSLRKKFGLGTLTRANSKSEEESKVAAVWRSLSKSTRGDASPAGSISKATLQRSHSTDINARGLFPRPASQDGPSLKPSALEDAASLTGLSSTQNLGLSTIGEHPSFIPTGPPRKKRRSSLSDLKALESTQKAQPWMSPSPRRPPLAQRHTDDKSLPASPMPSTPSSRGGSGRFGSPIRETPRSRLPPSFRRENSPGADKSFGVVAPLRPRSSSKQPEDVVITARPTSSIPTLAPRNSTVHKAPSPSPRVGLSERAGAGNIVKRPSPQPEKVSIAGILPSAAASSESGTPRKLRMQSPQKLRERLQNEQTSLTTAQTSLQDELSKIGDELTATPSRIGSIRAPRPITTYPRTSGAGSTNIDLAQRVLKMEGTLTSQIDTLTSRLAGIQSDLSSSLTVSENKCKRLDELYREANGENEALYARFNDELGRILKVVKAGEGVEELKRQLQIGQEETARLKKEVGRLRRENAGLRAQMK
ncbi:hypothetical protein LTR78_002097 [Recurvomyces mirabilis]|uniref:DH domain-containing protein n=1 Tax=Recurvomyces mirabilis TaxID=574656 RepID=A0AAE1C4Q0_9PEZI|nr:hypothetical protein LTR78_002097 [Recurvomyces mirabilis]KAK5160555.1 hypothetical protein LTS14_001567 [Recurvomyces mirabilis]